MVEEKYTQNTYDIDEKGHVMEASNSSIPGFSATTNFRPRYSNDPRKKKSKRSISKFFSDMSRFGMSYDEDVVKNLRAIPADKDLVPKDQQIVDQDWFNSALNNWKKKAEWNKNIYETDLPAKREALRNLAVQPELEDILDTMTNEAIVYDSEFTYFAEPFIEIQELKDIKKKLRKEIQDDMMKHFRRFYKMLNWKYRAWDDFKRFLIEGNMAWEIVWDSLEKPKKIIGLVPIDPITLTKKFENNKWYWIQFKGIQGKERKLLDSQIIAISYQETNAISRQSYLERLIRPFNLYRIIEQAQIIWTITNSSFKMKFTIPIKGMNKALGAQTLNSAMNRYREDINFNIDSGELKINGRSNMPFNKEYWMPEGDNGTPEIETIGGDGPDLSDNDQLKFFKNQLYKISKIPLNRFDQESGETWFGSDPTSVARTEIDFARFVTRLRNQFAQIMIKPLQLQLACDFPDLRENRELLEAVSMQFKSYNLFEEMMEIELTQKRIEFIQTMKESLIDMDVDGNEIKYFSNEFLIQKYLKYSQQDIDLNAKLKREEIEELDLAGGDGEGGYDESNESIDDIFPNITEDQKKRVEKLINKKKKDKKSEDNEKNDEE